jgi:hypothetical protein
MQPTAPGILRRSLGQSSCGGGYRPHTLARGGGSASGTGASERFVSKGTNYGHRESVEFKSPALPLILGGPFLTGRPASAIAWDMAGEKGPVGSAEIPAPGDSGRGASPPGAPWSGGPGAAPAARPRRSIADWLVSAFVISFVLAVMGAGLLFALQRGLLMFFEDEDFWDLQYYEYPYLGRLCSDLKVESSASRGTVKITNTGSRPLRNLEVRLKFFAHVGRTVLERKIEALEPGASVEYKDTDPELGLDPDIVPDLGMLYVRVRCDEGYAVDRGYWSYWD